MPHPNIRPRGSASYVRMCVAAASGYGKTVFSGTAPNALFLTTDPEGTASAKAFGSDAEEWPIYSTNDLDEAYVYLEQGGIAADGYEWVVVDNVSEAQRLYMDWGMETAIKLAEKDAKKEPRNPYVPDQREYLIEQNGILDFVRRMNSLPVNIIYTAPMVGREDGDANDYYSIDIRGKKGEIAQAVLGYMNIIGMGQVLDIGDPPKAVRRMYFSHTREFRGKDRFDKLGRYQDYLTVPKMMDIIAGSLHPKAPAAPAPTEPKGGRPRPRPRPAAR
jgi:hypothetical protein